VGNSATSSKAVVDPDVGTQNLKVLYNGTTNPYAHQTIMVVGSKYRVTGWARSGGVDTEYPRLWDLTGGEIWAGTSSTSWQYFDETFIARDTRFGLMAGANGAGEYCEFDDVTVTRVDELPVVATRAFDAYLDKIESDGTRKLYHVGSEWLRQCHRNDGTYDIYGYLSEVQSTNQIPYSEDIDNAAWNPSQVTFHATEIAAPDKIEDAIGMIASSVAGSHYIADTCTSSAGTDTVSFWAKKGDQDWIRMRYGLGSVASCYFDLDNGIVGSASNSTGYIEDWGNDWYRCIMVFTGDGAAHTFAVYLAEADNDVTFAGDDITASTYVWGVMYEQGIDYATSYIPTSGGTSTRLRDRLRHKGDDGNITNNQQGTFVCDILLPDFDIGSTKRLFSFNEGGLSTDRIFMYVSSTSDIPACGSYATAGNTGVSGTLVDVADGVKHALRMTWKTDELTQYDDGTPDSSPDTSCDMPDDLDRIEIGSSYSIAGQFLGLIQNIRIYDELITRG